MVEKSLSGSIPDSTTVLKTFFHSYILCKKKTRIVEKKTIIFDGGCIFGEKK